MSRSDPRSRDELISDISEHVVEEIRGQAAVVSVRLICRLAWINTRHALPDHVELKPRLTSNPVATQKTAFNKIVKILTANTATSSSRTTVCRTHAQ